MMEAGEKRKKKEAAVIVPIVNGDSILFIKRSRNLKHHSGEISFPGGQLEEGEDYRDAALRETREELGIEPESIEIIQELPDVITMRTNYHVVPFLARLGTTHLKPNPDEVERIIVYRIRDLMEVERCIIPGFYYIYPMPEGVIWGATARILHNLLRRMRSIPPGGKPERVLEVLPSLPEEVFEKKGP